MVHQTGISKERHDGMHRGQIFISTEAQSTGRGMYHISPVNSRGSYNSRPRIVATLLPRIIVIRAALG